MDPNLWQKIESIFNAALAVPEPDRQGFLESACKDDLTLRQEVDSLIAEVHQSDEFLSQAAFTLGAELLANEQAELLVGATLGPYKLLKPLGRGGMGDVFLAEDSRLERLVAVKLLPPSITQNDERTRRFQQEARAASATSHPNIAYIYEFGRSDDRDYLVMEYVEGKTLRELLKVEAIGSERAIDFALQVGQALQAAHEAGVVHRDIKPENLMIRRDGYVKVLDFGLAKMANRTKESEGVRRSRSSPMDTTPGMIMGTTAYMSPEQLRGETVDHRTDIWSLGVTLYEMLTGIQPFLGPTPSDTSAAVLLHEPESPVIESLVQGDATKLKSILLTSMQKDVSRRYSSAADFCEDLKQVQGTFHLHVSGSRTATSELRTKLQRRFVRTRTYMIGVAVLIVLALLVAGWLIFRARNRGQAAMPASGDLPCVAQSPVKGTGDERTVQLRDEVVLTLVRIPPGSFCRGSPAGMGLPNQGPQKLVQVQSSYIAKFEITQAQWRAVMGNNPSHFKGDNLPVENVSWNDVIAFVQKLNERLDNYSYRLPTEAEWEYACRAGTTGDFAGDLNTMAWFGDNSGPAPLNADAILRNNDPQAYIKVIERSGGRTHPVGGKLPNAFGLYDMTGNVWEWCEDWYHNDYRGAPDNGQAWLSDSDQKSRVFRGGSWYSIAPHLRSAYRDSRPPDFRSNGLGFRIAAVDRTQ